jgi:hypothetical protein
MLPILVAACLGQGLRNTADKIEEYDALAPAVRGFFMAVDTDHNGRLTTGELGAWCKTKLARRRAAALPPLPRAAVGTQQGKPQLHGRGQTIDHISQVFEQRDKDGDGWVLPSGTYVPGVPKYFRLRAVCT